MLILIQALSKGYISGLLLNSLSKADYCPLGQVRRDSRNPKNTRGRLCSKLEMMNRRPSCNSYNGKNNTKAYVPVDWRAALAELHKTEAHLQLKR